MSLEGWVQTPFAQALGAALLHSLWQGAAVAALLAGALWRCRESARLRHDLALAALVAMPALFLGTFAISLTPGGEAGGDAGFVLAGGAAETAGSGVAPWMEQASWVATLEKAAPRIVPWWLAGVLGFNLWQLGTWLAARRLRTVGALPASPDWQERLRGLGEKLGLDRGVALLESSRVDSPAVLGYWKPVVLVPLGLLAACPAEQIELILLHELAHLRRRDDWIDLLCRFTEGLFFYHPAVWWASSVIAEERENCCDDLAVAASGEPLAYARALAGLEGLRAAPALALGAADGSLLRRIRRIVGAAEPARSATPVSAMAGVLLAGGLALLAAWPTPATAQSAMSAAHEKWLKEDVVWLLPLEERRAFEALPSDAERDEFIAKFWADRDPTPGTPENEFKTEHYRRIAYVNDRYKDEEPRGGWRTERGRIYILLGPPDEIEAHPSGGGNPPVNLPPAAPYEMWRYRAQGDRPEGFFVFADRDSSGVFTMIRGEFPPAGSPDDPND
ncbi:MAG: GWxTD domain-containing protein [Acidobacteria bacterium]|nr:GWxTD domain-containing protein [Acidobacteriota bacterium]